MKYHDELYGEQEIDEPWVIEIINHPDFLRLRGVSQYGYIGPYHPEATTSRYEHSLGVFLLLRQFGLRKKEQLAGLMHDISHTVFSHCIDYVFDDQAPELQKYQDDHHEEYIKSSTVLTLINKHGFKIEDVVNYKNYKALELSLPDLCADRIDYVLRDAISFGIISSIQVKAIIDKLVLSDNKWIFNDIVKAKEFAYLFKKMNNDFYAAPWTGNMHSTVGLYVRRALKMGYIEKADLYLTEKEIIKKINLNFNDKILKDLWLKMNGTEFGLDEKNYDVVVKTKSRVVDPLVMIFGEIKRFSEIDKSWRKVVESEKEPKKYYIKYRNNEK